MDCIYQLNGTLTEKENKMEEERCCGTCIYNNYNNITGEWGCINADSEGYGLLTAYDDYCEEWEGKAE